MSELTDAALIRSYLERITELEREITRLEGWTRKIEAEKADLEREVERLSILIETYRQGVNTEAAHAYTEARREAMEECAGLPCPPAKVDHGIYKAIAVTRRGIPPAFEVKAYKRAWSDYAAAIRALEKEE